MAIEIVFGYDETCRIRCQKTFPNQWETSYEGAIYAVILILAFIVSPVGPMQD